MKVTSATQRVHHTQWKEATKDNVKWVITMSFNLVKIELTQIL